MRFAASCALAVLLIVAAPAGAAQGTRYVVQLSAAAVAERLELADHLARQYGGRMVDRDNVAGNATIELTAAQADALARDRRVASVTAIANTSSITVGPYVYDGSGNIIKIGNDTYRYDSLSRLISGTAAGGTRTQTYAYDGYGNLQKMVIAGGGASVTRELPINPATNRIATPTATSNVTATYDAAGNETSINNGPSRSYDALRMMTANGQGAVYIYTADDERIAVTNQTRTSWQWTLRGTDHKPLRELKETVSGPTHQWTWARDYVYADGTLLAAYVNHPTPARTLQHYHLDHLGTPRLITDSNGTEITRDELFAFGEDPAFNVGDPERLHFTGHERDYDGGTSVANGDYLDYMHARYYSPTLGRFLSVDPTLDVQTALRVPQTWNRYAYGRNNPTRFTDPDGKVAIADGVVIGAVVGVVILTAYVQAPSVAVPGKTNGQVLVDSAIGGFQALGRAVGSLIPGRQPTSLPPPPPPTTPSRPSTPGTQATTGVNPAAPIQAVTVNTAQGTVHVPDGWTSRPADNGKGTVYQAPGVTGNKDMIRVMDPTKLQPTGYVVIYNGQGNRVLPDGKAAPDMPSSHLPIVK